MARFFTSIGFVESVEVEPGIWDESIIERSYYCELTRNARALQTSDSVHDDIRLSNTISVVADPYAKQNFLSIRYIVFEGVKWKVSNVDVQYPRLHLTLGGVYNG